MRFTVSSFLTAAVARTTGRVTIIRWQGDNDMTRLTGLLLVLLLLLCGCAQEQPDTTAPSDELPPLSAENTQETVPGSYMPESELEKATAGAVRCFSVSSGVYGSLPFQHAATLVLKNADGAGVLELLDGEALSLTKSIPLGEGVLPDAEQFFASEQGLAYYDGADAAMVFLDHELREAGRLQMPEDVLGAAWLSPDWKTVYYCAPKGIYTLDLQSGVSRVLREHRSAQQQLTGIFAGGKVLRWKDTTAQGQAQTALVDAATGAVISEGAHFDALRIWSNRYYFARYDGVLLRLHFGTGEEPSEIIWPLEEGDAYPLLSDDALTVVTPKQDGITLTYYRLNAGTRFASVSLPGATKVYGIRADGWGGVWFHAEDAAGAPTLCHWDPAKSTVEDTECYKTPFFSAEQPNEPGLRRLESKAQELGDRFGVDILLWKDAAALAPSDHVFQEEYLTEAYEKILPELEKALSPFPMEFYKKTAWDTKLKIALVRSMTGDPAQGCMEKPTNVQYWHGKEPVIALAMGGDTQRDFSHAIALLLETEVLSKSRTFYEWHKLNPGGFAYDNNYATNANRTDTRYIDGNPRYFIDLVSMSYAKEDRARIFEYACLPGNEAVFRAPVLQQKLQRICKGIRDVYGLEQTETPFVWEQYLTK